MFKRATALLVIVLAIVLGQAALARAPGKLVELKQIPKSAQIVTVGFYPISIYGVDSSTSSFTYDGYIWFRWKGDIDPTKTLELVNAVDKANSSQDYLYDAPQIMPDGSKYQIMRIESQFFNPASLGDFPLDKHDLTITIEDSLSGVNDLVYQIDNEDTSYGGGLAISGWKLNGWSSRQMLNDYSSTFGDKSTAQASKYARLNYSLNISRPQSYFFWKLLLPLAIVLCGAWIALMLNPALTETRAALPASALLTTVFLQQSYTSSLPETGGLVLIDKIYVIAYVLIVLTLGRVILKSRDVERMDDSQLIALRKSDMRACLIQAGIFVAGTALIVLLR